MPSSIPFAQLWHEEESRLATLATSLRPGSVIVELGTAQGGSAFIFGKHKAAQTRLHSFDIAPSREAAANLRGIDVEVHAMSSTTGAAFWTRNRLPPVDLLLIDASHTLIDVVNDYRHWRPLLAPDARVLLHDVDPIERGGVAHLGVRVFAEALMGSPGTRVLSHHGRLLEVSPPADGLPLDESCCRVWTQICASLDCCATCDWSVWASLGTEASRALLPLLLDHPPTATTADAPCLLLDRPLSDESRKRLSARPEATHLLDDLTLTCLFERAMQRRRDELLYMAPDRALFFKIEEHLQMLAHAMPGISLAGPQPTDLLTLSKVLGYWIIRLGLVANLLRIFS